MGRATTLMILAVALLLIIAPPVPAKDGFYLGVNALFNNIGGDVNIPKTIDAGNGLGLHAGFGLNRYLAVEAGIWKTKHANESGGSAAQLEAGTIDLKINVPLADNHIEPYLLAGAGRYTIEQNGSLRDGKGGRYGIGMEIYLFPDISFNVGITRSKATFNYNSVDTDGVITTMDYGLSYHFR